VFVVDYVFIFLYFNTLLYLSLQKSICAWHIELFNGDLLIQWQIWICARCKPCLTCTP